MQLEIYMITNLLSMGYGIFSFALLIHISRTKLFATAVFLTAITQ